MTERIKTERLLLTSADEKNLPALEVIEKECDAYFAFDPPWAGELADARFKTIKTHCSLRNALSLRFWVKNGFDRITEIDCTGNLYPDNFSGIGLMKNI